MGEKAIIIMVVISRNLFRRSDRQNEEPLALWHGGGGGCGTGKGATRGKGVGPTR